MPFRRAHGRAADELRPARIELGAMKYAEGSALVEMGETRVLVAASVESRVPPFLSDSGRGWVTAEYAMLPRATHTRSRREVSAGKPSGRSSEIQRLIGRSLRAVVDLSALPDRTITVDCDVIQADGGTRTASITGAYVAMAQAMAHMLLSGDIARWPIRRSLAAVSVGVVEGVSLLDLEASEDQQAEVDMNVVATGDGQLVEVQGTGEKSTFSRAQLDELLDLAFAGIDRLGDVQNGALGEVLAEVESVEARGPRRAVAPKSEKGLWGPPE